MGNEEPTRDARTRRIIGNEINLARTGIITRVYEHTETDDFWNFHVDVRLGPDKHPRKVPVAVPGPELAIPPRSVEDESGGDYALVQYMEDDETERPVVTHIMYNNEDRPPLGTQGVFRLRRGDLYTESHPKGEWARIAKKSEDDGTPSTKIEIDDSGPTTQVNIETDGDINISAGGDILIDEGGTAEPVARQDHDHDFSYSWSDSGGSSSGTTSTPNQSGTSTEIE